MRSPAWMRALGLCALVLGAGAAQAQDRPQDPIKIGWLSSLTGPLSSAAIAENQGVQFAVDEINRAGGINGRKLELLTRDTAGEPTKAVNLAQQLLFSDKVQFIIGPVNSGESLATVPIVARAGIPNIVIGSIDELIDAKKYPLAFRAINTNTQWISGGNAYALDVLKRRKVAVIGDTSGYGTSSAKTAAALLEQAGVKPVYSVLIDPNKTDLTDEMTKARAAGADVVMPWTAATGLMARILNTRGDMGWDVPVVGHPAVMALPIKGLLNKPEYWQNAFAAGYQSTTYVDGKLPPRTQALIDTVKPALGGRIDFTFWWVALGYDTVKIIEHAVKSAGSTDPQKVKTVLEGTKDFPGVYATYTWSPENHNGFPDRNIVANIANTFRDGCYDAAPR
ncbi:MULTISPECIES: ABC transporter substrate-binding protein [Methylobacterium]|uniref:Leu/Ile/Val-binding protein n=1 Tax=Methylobacterium isbiliense TaxID=315478 RepID=A0ABQ4SLY4_9HYPH|nr:MULTISPECIES: ABC transporter substrate-binding protein [Methylobacterium]MBY0296199.1 ABC transporter substrate-binding protein [Methylobacterium sp.]MDN3623916.1 ABC transporter substrate-binding protein [Methylobacterium isbiliense]GJE02769.1 Leu/Ile/Val-binding protein [Methylobacterium isbiliense]